MDFRRRLLLKGALSSAFCASTIIRSNAEESDSRGSEVEAWVENVRITKSSDSPLKLERFREPIYILAEPITWKPSKPSTYQPVTVLKGFVTDLASVPSVFFSVLRPDADYAYAAIIHDFLYWSQAVPKGTADEIFKMSMEDFEVDKQTVAILYAAVITFGNRAWDMNATLRRKGEHRVLSRFPPNARTKWTDWKATPDVFSGQPF